jgi:hypothetical protein
MERAASALRRVATAGETLSIDGSKVDWHLHVVGKTTMPDIRTFPKSLTMLGEDVAMSVISFPFREDGNSRQKSTGGVAKEDLVAASIIHTDICARNGEALANKISTYSITRTGGRDAEAAPNSLKTLETFTARYLSGYNGILIGEVIVAFPNPKTEASYVPNYAFLLQGQRGEYGAHLVIGDRLVSESRLVIPASPDYTLLMDYSDLADLRFLEAKPTVTMAGKELTQLTENFDYSVILLAPVKDEPKLDMGRFFGEGHEFGGSGLTRGMSFSPRLRSTTSISSAAQNTGSSSGIMAGQVTGKIPDRSRTPIMLFVRSIAVGTEE